MDTSALVTRMTRRNHGGALDASPQQRVTEPLATSTPCFTETVRTLDLMEHFPKAMEAMEAMDARITEVLLAREVRDGAALLVGRLRVLDAVHAAGALSPRDGPTALVTYDRGMLETARAEGPSAHAPGTAD
ncbi:PIN domain-containing protein [Streptomyces sp. KMM 9044]|uniref:PIN domain-containing protein n=1 Tax=Streptomyces sp. KMM 9044 TaxID=2744474 RepID=UPI002151BA50|nr:PIN domain-containing protein [Streptomyces sp. KMM 9044]WAX82071.1 PIN domain-containing protein [Streptomyces sp. KMM 9044]